MVHKLDEFVVGHGNELAFAAATSLVDAPPGVHAPLVIHGGCGLGKTHLLQGICRQMAHTRPDARVLYTTAEQFTNEFITAMRAGKTDAFRRKIRHLDLLAIDDVQFLAGKKATQQEFLHSFDAIALGGARVAMASDNHPKQIKQLSEALVSRCVRGMVVKIEPPDTATRVRIVRALAKRRNLSIVDGVIEVLAQRSEGSVRDIEGALTKLHALASLANQKDHPTIGHALLNRLCQSERQSRPSKAVQFDDIVEAVCHRLQIERTTMMNGSRHRTLVLARAITCLIARQMMTMSYPEIATAMGRPNHSTVITAIQRIEKQIAAGQTVQPPCSSSPVAVGDLVEQVRCAVLDA